MIIGILQPFRHFTYVTTHSPTFPSLCLRYSSFSNFSVASPTSQFILQSFFRFSYVTSSSINSHGEPPMIGFRVGGHCLHGMACPQVVDKVYGLQIWRVAANILNKQLWTADKRWSSSLEFGRRTNNPSP